MIIYYWTIVNRNGLNNLRVRQSVGLFKLILYRFFVTYQYRYCLICVLSFLLLKFCIEGEPQLLSGKFQHFTLYINLITCFPRWSLSICNTKIPICIYQVKLAGETLG